jgi:hypothetical protein
MSFSLSRQFVAKHNGDRRSLFASLLYCLNGVLLLTILWPLVNGTLGLDFLWLLVFLILMIANE